jgi:hypothetical protein
MGSNILEEYLGSIFRVNPDTIAHTTRIKIQAQSFTLSTVCDIRLPHASGLLYSRLPVIVTVLARLPVILLF